MTIESHHWVVLAKDRNAVARGRLLIDLSRTVLEPGHEDGPEHAIFYDIVRSILESVSTEDRRSFADLAADRSPFPRDVLMRLAHDDITVAEPILHRAIGLREDDLADIAGRFGTGHCAAIAMRRVVSPRIVRILLNRGGREVLLGLGANPGAALDANDLRELNRRAETDGDLRSALKGREVALGADASPPRRKTEGQAKLGRDAPARPTAPAFPRPRIDALVEGVKAGTKTLAAVVVDLADGDHHADLACFLGRLADIDEAAVLRVLVRADVDGIAMLAGGLALAEEAFDRLIELRRRKLRFTASQVRWEREAYRKLDRTEARTRLDALSQRRRVA